MSGTDWSEGWHFSSGVGQEGPVSAQKLVSLHLKKQVRPEDQVWHPGLPDWCSLREAWPKLRPFKDEVLGRSSSGKSSKKREYRVVELPELTTQQIEEILNAQSAEGFAYDNAINHRDRTLLVFRK